MPLLILSAQLGNCRVLLHDDILLRLQLVAQLAHLTFVIRHVIGVITIETSGQRKSCVLFFRVMGFVRWFVRKSNNNIRVMWNRTYDMAE